MLLLTGEGKVSFPFRCPVTDPCLGTSQTGVNICLVTTDESWAGVQIPPEEPSSGPGASASDFPTGPFVFPLHQCLAACGRPAQFAPWRKFITSPVRSSEVGLAPRLVGAGPIVCSFASSGSRALDRLPDRCPRTAAPADALIQPAWSRAFSSGGLVWSPAGCWRPGFPVLP